MSKSLGTIGFRRREEGWQPHTQYRADDTILHGRSTLYAKEDHTSGDEFDPEKWGFLADATGVQEAAERAEAAAEAAETNADEAGRQADYAREAGDQATAQAEAAQLATRIFTENFKEFMGDEFVYAVVDSEGTLLWGIRADGTTYTPKGMSEDTKKRFKELEGLQVMENDKYLFAIVDSANNVLFAIDKQSRAVINGLTGIIDIAEFEGSEFLYAVMDSAENLLFGVKRDGRFYASKFDLPQSVVEDIKKAVDLGISFDEDDKEFVYKITDAENRLLFGITRSGQTRIPKGIPEEQDAINRRTTARLTSLEAALKNFSGGTGDWSDKTAFQLPFPKVPAIVSVEGSIPTSKYIQVWAKMTYIDMLGNKFTKPIYWNTHGNISSGFDKKNFGVDILNSFDPDDSCDIQFGNWVPQDSYHFKAYISDFWKIRSLGVYRYFEKIQESRDVFNRRPWDKYLLSTANQSESAVLSGGIGTLDKDIDTGALAHPDGFPFMLFINGNPWGLYTMNLKKSKENYHVVKNDDNANQMFSGDYMTGVFMRYNNAYWTLSSKNLADPTGISRWDENTDYNVGDIVYDEETFDFKLNGKTTSITIRRKFTCATAYRHDALPNNYRSLRPGKINWRQLEMRNPKKTICVQADGTLAYYDYDSPSDYAQTGYYERTHEIINPDEFEQGAVTASRNHEGEKFSKKEYTRSINVWKKIDEYSKVCPILAGTLTNGNLLDWEIISINDVPQEHVTDGVVSEAYRAMAASSSLQKAAKKALFDEHHDLQESIDFFLMYNLTNYADSITHNTLYLMYDGQHVIPTIYDTDISLGMSSTYTNSFPSVSSSVLQAGNTMMEYLYAYHAEDIKARWAELRASGVLSQKTFNEIVWGLVDSIGYENYLKERIIWPNQPSYRRPTYWRMNAGSLQILKYTKNTVIDGVEMGDYKGELYHGYDESLNTEREGAEQWAEGVAIAVGEVKNYNGHSYTCTAAHTSNSDRRPDKCYTCGNPTSGGVYDSPRRIIEWHKKRMQKLDAAFGYSE